MGRASALRFAREGARLAICDIQPQKGDEIVREMKRAGGDCLYLTADVTNRVQVAEMVNAVKANYRAIDILVNNVGGDRYQLFIESEEDDWKERINLNLMGTLQVTRAVLETMVHQRSGSIVNIASSAGQIGGAGYAVYSACKGAIIAITKAWAREFVDYNIRVNAVAPGSTGTPYFMSHTSPEEKAKLLAMIPMARLGQPQEVAAAVFFLAADEASFITGQTLGVNGGKVML